MKNCIINRRIPNLICIYEWISPAIGGSSLQACAGAIGQDLKSDRAVVCDVTLAEGPDKFKLDKQRFDVLLCSRVYLPRILCLIWKWTWKYRIRRIVDIFNLILTFCFQWNNSSHSEIVFLENESFPFSSEEYHEDESYLFYWIIRRVFDRFHWWCSIVITLKTS
jgi:hypothetical protein